MITDRTLVRKVVEGALLAADRPLNLNKLAALFEVPEGEEAQGDKPDKAEILAILEDIQADCGERGFELKEVGSGWRFQVVQEVAPWVGRLWEEKPQKYSRAVLETLALIAYRQPITRGDIESIRGVAVSSTIIKTLTEREWVKVVGHRDVPGRPALYATTREFLDYFNLKSLDELPSLKEIQDLDQYDSRLELGSADQEGGDGATADGASAGEGSAQGETAGEDSGRDSEPPSEDREASGARAEASVAAGEPVPDEAGTEDSGEADGRQPAEQSPASTEHSPTEHSPTEH